MQLNGNTVFITGGTSGIGLALARAFHDRGNQVIVCGRDSVRLEAVGKSLAGIVTYPCDITDDAAQQALIDTLTRRHPPLNILINNAGIQHNYSLAEGGDAAVRIEEELSVNVLAPMKLTARLLPHLLAQPHAAIVNVTSALAVTPKQNAAVYCATKAAMRSFTQTLRYQLEDTPVAVFELIPALVETAMTEGRGVHKISPTALAEEALRALMADREEIRIDKVKLLFALHRWLPSVAARMLRYSQ